jgi:hypothetical protein
VTAGKLGDYTLQDAADGAAVQGMSVRERTGGATARSDANGTVSVLLFDGTKDLVVEIGAGDRRYQAVLREPGIANGQVDNATIELERRENTAPRSPRTLTFVSLVDGAMNRSAMGLGTEPPEGVTSGENVPRESEPAAIDESLIVEQMNMLRSRGKPYSDMNDTELREKAVATLRKYGVEL